MKHTCQNSPLLAIFLVCLSLLSGCSKESSKPKDITIVGQLDASQKDTNIQSVSIPTIKIGDVIPDVQSFESSYGKAIVLKDNNDYTFELEYIIGFTPPLVRSKFPYSGSIPKAMFTKTESANVLKIAVVGRQPILYMNGVRLPNPTGGTGSGPTPANTCYVGTWKTAGGCTSAPTRELTYYFGPLDSNGNGIGYSQGPDCSGQCSSTPRFNFTYTVTGNRIDYRFTSVNQPVCNVSVPTVQVPQGSYSITYTCGNNNNQLVTEAVNVQTGVRTVLTFTRG